MNVHSDLDETDGPLRGPDLNPRNGNPKDLAQYVLYPGSYTEFLADPTTDLPTKDNDR